MSDISALSNDYEETSHFAERVNSAVLGLKRSLRRPEQHLDLADLATIVEAVRKQLTAPEPSADIPSEIVHRLSSEHQSQLTYLLEDLDSAAEALRGRSAVDSTVIPVLDAICDAADASASAMFRRLRRR
jgi:hypothetical protein